MPGKIIEPDVNADDDSDCDPHYHAHYRDLSSSKTDSSDDPSIRMDLDLREIIGTGWNAKYPHYLLHAVTNTLAMVLNIVQLNDNELMSSRSEKMQCSFPEYGEQILHQRQAWEEVRKSIGSWLTGTDGSRWCNIQGETAIQHSVNLVDWRRVQATEIKWILLFPSRLTI